MVTSPRFKFIATLVVAVLAAVLTLDTSERSLLDVPLAMQTPQR